MEGRSCLSFLRSLSKHLKTAQISLAADCPSEIRQAVEEAIAGLDNGTLRVAEKSMVNGLFING